jgi:hypothetical protein
MAKPDESAIIMTSAVAIKIGELLCDALYGDLSLQRPLTATDNGSSWRVEGARNRDGTMEGPAQFFLSIGKSDGRVTGVGEAMRLDPSPSVISILAQHFAGEYGRQSGELKALKVLSELDKPDETDRSNSDACMLLLNSIGRGGLIYTAELAEKIGEVLCEAHYGDLSRQMPLSVVDKETYWRVEGNWNRHGKLDGPGPFYISIAKDDSRITAIGE